MIFPCPEKSLAIAGLWLFRVQIHFRFFTLSLQLTAVIVVFMCFIVFRQTRVMCNLPPVYPPCGEQRPHSELSPPDCLLIREVNYPSACPL